MRQDKTSRIDMLHGSLAKNIPAFALPLFASGLLQQSFNAVDIAVIGRFSTSEDLAAVGSNGSVISLMINLFVGIAVGVNVIVARHIGQGDSRAVRKAVGTAAVIACASGIFLLVLGLVAAEPILRLLDTPENVIEQASLYLRIYFTGVPFIMAYNFGAAVLKSVGDTRRPFYSLIVAGVVNAILDVVLVTVFDMGVAGVAVATAVANVVNAAIVVRLLVNEADPIRIDLRHMRVDRPELGRILRIGVPTGLQGMIFSLSNVFIQSAINALGSDAVAGSAAALNFEYYCDYAISAFVQTTIAFTSQNYGAGNIDRCKRIFWLNMLFSVVSCGVLNVSIAWQSGFFASLFTSDPDVLHYARIRMHVVLMWQFIASSYDISGGALRGLGYSLTPTVFTIFGTCLLRIVWIHTVVRWYDGDFTVLMCVYPLSWTITGIAVLTAYAVISRKAYAIPTKAAHSL